jgi:hypothetical protein
VKKTRKKTEAKAETLELSATTLAKLKGLKVRTATKAGATRTVTDSATRGTDMCPSAIDCNGC